MPLEPKLLDYENTQFLLIGAEIGKISQGEEKDQKHDKETPLEELEKLEHEDDLRVQHLKGTIHIPSSCALKSRWR